MPTGSLKTAIKSSNLSHLKQATGITVVAGTSLSEKLKTVPLNLPAERIKKNKCQELNDLFKFSYWLE